MHVFPVLCVPIQEPGMRTRLGGKRSAHNGTNGPGQDDQGACLMDTVMYDASQSIMRQRLQMRTKWVKLLGGIGGHLFDSALPALHPRNGQKIELFL